MDFNKFYPVTLKFVHVLVLTIELKIYLISVYTYFTI